MGGYGSGRRSQDRLYVEDLQKLDVCKLYREKSLGQYGLTSFFINGFNYYCDGDTLQCPTMIINGNQVQQTIQIVWKSVLGGKTTRPYFICPLSGETVSTLYLGYTGYGSRKHYKLVYRQQDMGKQDRLWLSAGRIRHKLKASRSHFDIIFKPKGMHDKTFEQWMSRYRKIIAPAMRTSYDKVKNI